MILLIMMIFIPTHTISDHVKDIGYIRVQYAPVIARVCGFARGAAESKKPQTSVITGVYCTSMHPISDLLP